MRGKEEIMEFLRKKMAKEGFPKIEFVHMDPDRARKIALSQMMGTMLFFGTTMEILGQKAMVFVDNVASDLSGVPDSAIAAIESVQNGTPVIVVNKTANKLPKDQLMAIMRHEMAHIVLGHNTILGKFMAATQKYSHDIEELIVRYQKSISPPVSLEMEADALAAKDGYKDALIKALTKTAEGMPEHKDMMNKRIDALRNAM